jgi:hypothetical protein
VINAEEVSARRTDLTGLGGRPSFVRPTVAATFE